MANDISVDVEFCGREDNAWGDAPANGNCNGFDPNLWYNPDLTSDGYWHVLPHMLKLGTRRRWACTSAASGRVPTWSR